jgi:hypothetical protein
MKPKTNDEIRQGLKAIADKLEGQIIEPYYTNLVKEKCPELFKQSVIAKGNKVR